MRIKIITFLLSIIYYGVIAQVQQSTVKVTSRVVYIDPTPIFKAEVSMSNAFSGAVNTVIGLEELKSQFRKIITDSALSWSNVKENPGTFGFESMGYNNMEGIIYEYQTKSVDEMKRFLNIKSPILQRLDASSTIEIDDEEAQKITQMAFDEALKKATLLANTLHKKVGAIIAVEENGSLSSKPYSVSLYYSRPPRGIFL